MSEVAAPPRSTVVGVGISTTSYEQMAEVCRRWSLESRRALLTGESPRGHYVCVTSVHGIVTSVSDPIVKSDLNGADAATPDGMPIVWALRSFGSRNQQRVYGPNLMVHLCRMATVEGLRIFLYGASNSTLELLTANLRRQFPEIDIAGTFSPPYRALTPEESADVRNRIMDSGADLVFVGLSTPRQERWMAENREHLAGKTLIGVGAAFDFHAGTLRQAPLWIQQSGLEWLFRLTMEPRRLWKRYVLVTPLFIPLWALQKLKLLRYGPVAEGNR
jgi:N-acetylglucosaminyldiphosphoundecaprenol N-acetyl-beta-D-mannosaminyltransferase